MYVIEFEGFVPFLGIGECGTIHNASVVEDNGEGGWGGDGMGWSSMEGGVLIEDLSVKDA